MEHLYWISKSILYEIDGSFGIDFRGLGFHLVWLYHAERIEDVESVSLKWKIEKQGVLLYLGL